MGPVEQVMTNDARNSESGRFVEKYPREEFLSAISKAGGSAGTGEIARIIGCDHDTAYKKLHRMERDGIVAKRNIGNTLLWRES
jgi:DNA-binding MarR family transcriptional regulator